MDLDEKYCFFKIERPVYQIKDINEAINNTSNKDTVHYIDKLKNDKQRKCRFNLRNILLSKVPAIDWLSTYNWKTDLFSDLIAGFTVAVMNIPQGMAYAMLANIPPVVGIYMAFFPVLVYALLGTSRHISMGSFAVVCLMVGKVVFENSDSTGELLLTNSTRSAESAQYTNIEVATAVSLAVGLCQILMCIFHLDIMCTLLSDTLVSSFTAGAAVHVFVSQIKDLFGFKFKSPPGSFQLIYTFVGIFNNLQTINWAATTTSLITIMILIINNTLLKSLFRNRYNIPLPMELILVLIGTLLSKYSGLSEIYSLTSVGHISIGLPEPTVPKFMLIPSIAFQCFIIAVVAYIVSVSMAMIFAQKLKYEINANQELFAQGTANIVGSFFSCAPIAASLSRSVIQQTVGGKTQLTSVISSVLLLAVLLWIGPFFEPLPTCILSSLIVVALKPILCKVTELPQIWKLSVLDGIVWIITYLTVILVEIDIGLLSGLFVSIISLFVQGMKPYTCLLGKVPGTDIYVDKTKYLNTVDPVGIRIIHYAGGLNFANRGFFKNETYKLINKSKDDAISEENTENVYWTESEKTKIQYIIIDLSGFHYIDPSGAATMKSMASEFKYRNITIYGAGASEPVYESFILNGLMDSNLFTLFPTIHDAVLYAQHKMLHQKDTINVIV